MTDQPIVSIDAAALDRGVVIRYAEGKSSQDDMKSALELLARLADSLEGFASWARLEIAEKARAVPPYGEAP